MSQIGFVGRRVRSSLRELLWSHILTSGTMAMSLFVFGAFMLLQENLQHFLTGLGDQIRINAYLEKGLGTSDVQSLGVRIKTFPEVERARHISQEQAWLDFSAALGAQSSLLDGLPRDALPSSFEILLKPAYRDGPVVEDLANRLKKEKGITAVEYPQEWIDRLSLVVLAVQWTKWFLGGVLFMAAFFIAGSTVKLAILARKDEIEIMQLVGASEELIQAPFVLEGMIQGIAAGAVSVVGLWSLFRFLDRQVASSVGLFGASAQLQFLDLKSIALLLAIGWLLGAAGSLFALRRFVRTWKS
ncbi:MAG: ABC transporter permease [Deltaproteobacteria bacterium]|nr:ABC transporter permease [Deltaproteobacteria bacterium]